MGGAKLKAGARILKTERKSFIQQTIPLVFILNVHVVHFIYHLSCRVTAVASHTSVTWCPLKPIMETTVSAPTLLRSGGRGLPLEEIN